MPQSRELPGSLAPRDLGLSLDLNSFVPYYEQLFEQVRSLVKHKVLVEGETFCSEGEVARALKISKMPVRQAFQKLRAEGFLIIAKGKKPVVSSGRVPWNFQQLRGFSEEMRRRGLQPSARLITIEQCDPASDVAQALKLTPSEKVYRLQRLRSVNDEPVAVVTSYLPSRIFSGIENQDLEGRSLYEIFEQVFKRKLQHAEESIGAVVADAQQAEILLATAGSPLLVIKETTFDSQGVAIEYSISLLRADRYTASVISVRRT